MNRNDEAKTKIAITDLLNVIDNMLDVMMKSENKNIESVFKCKQKIINAKRNWYPVEYKDESLVLLEVKDYE